MSQAQEPRGFWSTFIISFCTNGVGGLLWIGRPKFAFVLLAAIIALIYCVLTGWLTAPSFLPLSGLKWIAIAVLVLIPVILRNKSVPTGWPSKLLPALAIPIFLSALAAISIRSLAYQPFNSASNSMAPTLIEGDVFVANKSIYGYTRVSFPFEILNFTGRTAGSLPKRGDVVMFRANGFDYVKRIVGLPSETIQMINGVPVINGVAVKHEAIGEYLFEADGSKATEVREFLPEGRNYSVLNINAGNRADDTREFPIPEGQYFVLGDNRDNSNDSRFDMGFIALESIIGRADRIIANDKGLEFVSRKNLNAT